MLFKYLIRVVAVSNCCLTNFPRTQWLKTVITDYCHNSTDQLGGAGDLASLIWARHVQDTLSSPQFSRGLAGVGGLSGQPGSSPNAAQMAPLV